MLVFVLASAERTEQVDGGAEWLFLKHLPATAVESVVDQWSDNTEMSCKLINNSRLIAEGGRYRVTQEIERVMLSRIKRVGLERMERPIAP